jgi:site-specific recombinase XerD
MEYLQEAEINALLKASHEYGSNQEAHLALLTMYATGTRVSQALKLNRFRSGDEWLQDSHRTR